MSNHTPKHDHVTDTDKAVIEEMRVCAPDNDSDFDGDDDDDSVSGATRGRRTTDSKYETFIYLKTTIFKTIRLRFRGDESDYSEDVAFGENRSEASAASSAASQVEPPTATMTKYVADACGEVFGTANDQVRSPLGLITL